MAHVVVSHSVTLPHGWGRVGPKTDTLVLPHSVTVYRNNVFMAVVGTMQYCPVSQCNGLP
jgi:hypothetical protein